MKKLSEALSLAKNVLEGKRPVTAKGKVVWDKVFSAGRRRYHAYVEVDEKGKFYGVIDVYGKGETVAGTDALSSKAQAVKEIQDEMKALQKIQKDYGDKK